MYSPDLRHFLILGPNSKWIQPVLTILSSYRKDRPIFAIWVVHFRTFDCPLKFKSRQRFIYDKSTGKMIFKESTRGSKFWSSKVYEGGESREAYAFRLNFGPPQFLFERNDHVTKIHFWSAFKLIENSILVHFH